MAETSGFFDSVYDEETKNYDLTYFAEQFANYFSLFIKNGVFGSPTNQLKVFAGDGLQVIVSKGWAFINGYWYYNDSEKILNVPPNSTSQIRTDSVKCRLYDRKIQSLYFNNDVSVQRDSIVYDLKLAEIIVPPVSNLIIDSNITDTRMNENVCGFVTQLLEVQTTEDLFKQYDEIFKQWFNGVRDTLSEDVAGNLYLKIEEVENKIPDTSLNRNNILFAGETSITIYDERIKPGCAIQPFTSIYGVNPLSQTAENGSVTLTFSSQENDMEVGVVVYV